MRLFFALDLPDAANRLPPLTLRPDLDAHLRRVPPASWHVTLAFLGEVEADRVAAILATVAALPAVGPIELQPAGVGFFPPRGPPRVLVVHLAEQGDRLARRYAALGAALAPLGFPPEHRPFRPHVTVARVRDPRRFPRDGRDGVRANASAVDAPIIADAITLYSSTLTPAGASYAVVGRIPL